MKRTPLFQEHQKLNARFTEFGGWEMPVQYTSVMDEHNAVRNHVGMFDASHMGLFIISGPGDTAFLDKVTTANTGAIRTWQAKYSLFLNERGGIVDDLIIYRREKDYMLIVNAGNMEKDFAWLQQHKTGDVELKNLSDETCLIAVQGPEAEKVFQPMVKNDLKSVKYFTFFAPEFNDLKPSFAYAARTGYTGEDGFEVFISNAEAPALWEKFIAAGVKPCGLGSRDTLRLEACMPLHGHEISDDITPVEAKLEWAVYWEKDFIGKEALLKQKQQGVQRHLVAFTLEGAIPRAHYPLLINGATAGEVVSGTFSPTFKKGIGIGYVNQPLEIGASVDVLIYNKPRQATVVKRPFYKRSR